MAVFYDDLTRNAMLDAISAQQGAGALLNLYSGSIPATEASALSGNTLLAVFTLAPAAASGGTKNFVPTQITDAADAAGTATFYRITTSGGTVKEQGTVGLSASNPDLVIDNTNITAGQTVNVLGFTKTAPG